MDMPNWEEEEVPFIDIERHYHNNVRINLIINIWWYNQWVIRIINGISI
jgi:hypothetical protein